MILNIQQEDPKQQDQNWFDLLLYIFGGFGLFTLFSILAGAWLQDVQQGTLWVIVAIFLNVFFLGGSVYAFGVMRGKTSWRAMRFWPMIWRWKWIFLTVGITLAILPIRGVAGWITQIIIEGNLDSLQARTDLLSVGGDLSLLNFLISLIGAGVIAPISEELYFRGLIHRWFIPRFDFKIRLVLSSIIFGLGHFDSAGVAASAFIMGIVLAFVYEKSKSLWLPIAIHMFTNSLGIILLYAVMLFTT
jgi:membrane protease YdiL (CAAX protease family)